ncbi:MAG: class II glutamine amidotransferase [Burkholderiales bacterium]|nr:class II glutamine amidotransferase [Burkholderiales bacterium]
MCELFAMSSRHPATVQMSLEEFARHGGLTGPNKDGWGIALYDDRDVRLIKDTHPAADSACERFIQDHPYATPFALSHVRRATQGGVALRNCQPFLRELGGAWHAFAHNGNLEGMAEFAKAQTGNYRPVGETDSERAFCTLLERLRPLWRGDATPELAARLAVIGPFAAELRAFGPANFLYCDGDALFVHADRRIQADGTIAAPGLWRLARHCAEGGELAGAGLRIGARGQEQEIMLFASVPLSAEGWTPLARGELSVARAGRILG